MERPQVTRDMIAQAARSLATSNGWDDRQVQDVVKHWRSHMDGYALAKELDTYCGWVIDTSDVEALDGLSSDVREIHRRACISWAREQKIQPPLPIGTMTTKGQITGISEYDGACYLIREHGETNESRRLVVRFEDARATSAVPA
jgi:hypothetical protein